MRFDAAEVTAAEVLLLDRLLGDDAVALVQVPREVGGADPAG